MTLHWPLLLCGKMRLSESPTCLMIRSRSKSTWNGKARQKVSELIFGSDFIQKAKKSCQSDFGRQSIEFNVICSQKSSQQIVSKCSPPPGKNINVDESREEFLKKRPTWLFRSCCSVRWPFFKMTILFEVTTHEDELKLFIFQEKLKLSFLGISKSVH